MSPRPLPWICLLLASPAFATDLAASQTEPAEMRLGPVEIAAAPVGLPLVAAPAPAFSLSERNEGSEALEVRGLSNPLPPAPPQLGLRERLGR